MEITPDGFMTLFISIEAGQIGAFAVIIWRLGLIQGALNEGRK